MQSSALTSYAFWSSPGGLPAIIRSPKLCVDKVVMKQFLTNDCTMLITSSWAMGSPLGRVKVGLNKFLKSKAICNGSLKSWFTSSCRWGCCRCHDIHRGRLDRLDFVKTKVQFCLAMIGYKNSTFTCDWLPSESKQKSMQIWQGLQDHCISGMSSYCDIFLIAFIYWFLHSWTQLWKRHLQNSKVFSNTLIYD